MNIPEFNPENLPISDYKQFLKSYVEDTFRNKITYGCLTFSINPSVTINQGDIASVKEELDSMSKEDRETVVQILELQYQKRMQAHLNQYHQLKSKCDYVFADTNNRNYEITLTEAEKMLPCKATSFLRDFLESQAKGRSSKAYAVKAKIASYDSQNNKISCT